MWTLADGTTTGDQNFKFVSFWEPNMTKLKQRPVKETGPLGPVFRGAGYAGAATEARC